MKRSESIVKLSVALVKFNLEVEAITKDSLNPHFKNKFASLDTLILNTKPILAKNGLTVMQFPVNNENGSVGIETILIHESGEFIQADTFYLKPVKQDPQGCGSAITYARRYSYQAILNLNMENDDDGNACSLAPESHGLSEAQVKRLYAIANKKGFAIDKVKKSIMAKYNKAKIEALTKKEYDEFIDNLEKLQDK